MGRDTIIQLTALALHQVGLDGWHVAFDDAPQGSFAVRHGRKLVTFSEIVLKMTDETVRGTVQQVVSIARAEPPSGSWPDGEYVAVCGGCGNRYYRCKPAADFKTFCYSCGKVKGLLVFS